MATNTCVFSTSSFPGKADLKKGASVNPYFAYSGGTRPKASSTVLYAVMTVDRINVYTSCGLDFGSYGSLALSTQSGDAQASGTLSGASVNDLKTFAINGGGSFSGSIAKSGSYSGNCCNFRSTSGSLTIYFEDTDASTGVLDKDSVEQNHQITLTVTKADQSYRHLAIWRSASGQSTTQDMGSDVTKTFTIPADWATGSATCTLQTLTSGGSFVGNQQLTFTVQIDTGTITPSAGVLSVTLMQSQYIPQSWGVVFVKGFSAATISLPNASAGSNATLSSITLSCGSQTQILSNNQSWLTDTIIETGTVVCKGSITNNYNNTADAQDVELTVYDYSSPQIVTVLAFRCLENGNPSDSGAYISIKASAAYASIGNKNSLASFSVQYKAANASTWSTAVSLTNGVTQIIGGNLQGSNTYQVRVVAVDQIQNLRNTYSERIENVLTSNMTIHCLDGGYNVSFGMQGTIPFAVQINENWKLYHGTTEINLDGQGIVTDSVPTALSTNPVQSGGTYDLIMAQRPSKATVQLQLASWQGSGPFTYAINADWASPNLAVVASPANEASANAMGAGILVAFGNGVINFTTSTLPSADLLMTIIVMQNGNTQDPGSFFVNKRGGSGYDGFDIVDNVFSNIVDNPNMLMLSGDVVTAVFKAAFSTKTLAANSLVQALSVSDNYKPFARQNIIAQRWNSTSNTYEDLPLVIDTDGTVKMSNSTGSAISFTGFKFIESWQPKRPRMVSAFYKVSGQGPNNLVFNVNQIIADTVTNKITYKLDCSYPTFDSGPDSGFTFGIKLPPGYGPNAQTYITATFYLSNGTTNTYTYFYMSRNTETLSLYASSISTRFTFELTTDLYQQYVYCFQSHSRTNVVFNTNRVEINPSTGKVRYQLNATFSSVNAYNYQYGTEIGFHIDVYNFRPKTLPSESFSGIAILASTGDQIAVECSLRGSSYDSSYACSLYVKSLDTSILYGPQITGIIIDYICDAYGY